MFQTEKCSVEQNLRARDVLTIETRERSTHGLLRRNHTEAARLAKIFQDFAKAAASRRVNFDSKNPNNKII